MAGWRRRCATRSRRHTPGAVGASASDRHGRTIGPAELRDLDGVFAAILGGAHEHLGAGSAPLAVEAWASELWSICQQSDLGRLDAEVVFGGGLIAYASARNSPEALAVLRSLAAVVPDPYRSRAGQAADRMADQGVAEPTWADAVRRCTPTQAWLVQDSVNDDGVSVLVGFDGPAGGEVVGLYVDHNLGGIAKDAFVLAAGIGDVVSGLRSNATATGVEFHAIGLDEAASRWHRTLALTRAQGGPPVGPEVHHLRALVETRLATLPAPAALLTPAARTAADRRGADRGGAIRRGDRRGAEPGGPHRDEGARRHLLDEFLRCDEAGGLREPRPGGDRGGSDRGGGRGGGSAPGGTGRVSTVEYLASQVMTFSLDQVSGASLRFSPVMVEGFCLDWAPRRIAAGPDAFALLPAVLTAWIRFAGRRRGIPETAIAEAVGAVRVHGPSMIERAGDPAVWDPDKVMAMVLLDRGVDMTDPEAVEAFVDAVNGDGGAEALAALFGRSDRSDRSPR